MQMPFKFIVSPIDGKQYNDIKKIGDGELITTISIEDHLDVQRIGIVRSLPIGYKGDIVIGELVIIHHNVFRIMFDHKGVPRQSDNHIKDDLFGITQDTIYAVIRNGEIVPTDDNVFVEPLIEESFWHGKQEVENIGIAKYVNLKLKSQGVENGSKIAFKNNSKYQFEIFGEKLYMMKSRRIFAKLN